MCTFDDVKIKIEMSTRSDTISGGNLTPSPPGAVANDISFYCMKKNESERERDTCVNTYAWAIDHALSVAIDRWEDVRGLP